MKYYKALSNYLKHNKITYAQYLGSEHWKDTRRRYWNSKLHDGKCYACGSTERLEVHHKTYKRIGAERLNDLCLLCRDCHHETHEIAKESKPRRALFNAAKKLRKQKGIRLGDHIGGIR